MRPVVGVIIIFLLTFIGLSWFVGKVYLSFVGKIFGSPSSILADVFVWLIVVLLLALILVLFRDLLQGIFYRELAKLNENKESVSSKTGLNG